MIGRRAFLGGLASAMFAPLVVHSEILMPISSTNILKRKFIISKGVDVGAIEEFAGTAPEWAIPCDGRLINGFDYPDLMRTVRGGKWQDHREDAWIHIHHEEGHERNSDITVDRMYNIIPQHKYWDHHSNFRADLTQRTVTSSAVLIQPKRI